MLQLWSQETEIGEVVGGEGERSDGWERAARCEAAGAYEVYADGVGTGKAVGSGAAVFGGWLWKAGKEVGIAVVGTFAVSKGAGVRREELEPSPDAGVVLAYFGDGFERLVVRVNAEFGGPPPNPFPIPNILRPLRYRTTILTTELNVGAE